MKEALKIAFFLLALTVLALVIPPVIGQSQSQSSSTNNVIGDAYELKPGQAVQHSISKAGEANYFLLPVETSGIISVSLDNVPSDMKPRITISNEYAGLWASAGIADKTATNAGDSLTLEKDVIGPSGYYITVWDADGKAHSSPYSLTVNFKPAPDANEPNNLLGEATYVKPNQQVNAYICPGDDVDTYRLDVNTSGILTLEMDEVPEDMKPHITLSNEYSGLWASAGMADKTATNAGDSLTLEKDLLGPSGYYISVTDVDRKGHANPYSLTFAFEPAPDPNEPNEDIGDATEIKLDQPITAYICPGSDKDFYKLYMSNPGVVVFKISDVPEDMRSYISIRDKNNRQIADKSATNPEDSLTLEKDLEAGWSYIAIWDADGKAHSQPYTLTATMKP